MSELLTYSRTQSFQGLPQKGNEYAYEIGLRPTIDAKALRIGTRPFPPDSTPTKKPRAANRLSRRHG